MIPQRVGNPDMFLQALRFAESAHAGQKRKFGGGDYVVHAVRVGSIAAALDPDISHEILAGFVLHDTVEDAEDPARMLGKILVLFSTAVADVVRDLTRGRKEPKDEYLQRVMLYPINKFSPIGKLCDRYDNLTDRWGLAPPEWKARYLRASTQLLALAKLNQTILPGGYEVGDHPAWWALKTRIDILREEQEEEDDSP